MSRAAAHQRPGRFQLEAAIQSAHCDRVRTGVADWNSICLLYDALVAASPTWGAYVARAAAIAQRDDGHAGLRALDALPDVARDFPPAWEVRAHLLESTGDPNGAEAAYRKAEALSIRPEIACSLRADGARSLRLSVLPPTAKRAVRRAVRRATPGASARAARLGTTMATPPPAPKQRWYKTLWQAYTVTARKDKKLPWIMGALLLGPLAVGIAIAITTDGVFAKIYAPLTGLMIGAVVALFVLTKRFEKQMYAQMEGTLGGSLAVAQSMRRGWQFSDEPVAVDAKAKAVVFQGVGDGGIVLLAEGGRSAKRTVDTTAARLHKLAPGVPVTPVYVGNGEGEVALRHLTKAIKATKVKHFGRGLRAGLSAGDQQAVRARLRALGGPQMPIPKGIDPNRARADRKGLRGR